MPLWFHIILLLYFVFLISMRNILAEVPWLLRLNWVFYGWQTLETWTAMGFISGSEIPLSVLFAPSPYPKTACVFYLLSLLLCPIACFWLLCIASQRPKE